MNGISALIKETPGSSTAPLPHEDTVRGWLAENQEAGLHQTLNLLATSPWTSSLPNREEYTSVIFKPPSLRYSVVVNRTKIYRTK